MLVFFHIPRCAGMAFNHSVTKLHGLDYKLYTDEVWQAGQVPPAIPFHYISGHFSHDHVMALGLYEVFTIIRDPVDRLASEYGYALTNPYHELHAFADAGFAAFVRWLDINAPGSVDDIQCRLLCGQADAEFAKFVLCKVFAAYVPFHEIGSLFQSVVRRLHAVLGVAEVDRVLARENESRVGSCEAMNDDFVREVAGRNLEDAKLFRWVSDNPKLLKLQ